VEAMQNKNCCLWSDNYGKIMGRVVPTEEKGTYECPFYTGAYAMRLRVCCIVVANYRAQ
jgi:hypothetical protein